MWTKFYKAERKLWRKYVMQHPRRRIVYLTKEQGEKLMTYINRKQQFHEAVRKYGPRSEEAKKLRP